MGFHSDRLLSVELTPPESDYPSETAAQFFFDRAVTELEVLPGVESVGVVTPLPMNHTAWSVQLTRPDRAPAGTEDWPVAFEAVVSPGYFETMGITVLAGRAFETGDGPAAPKAVIVSRTTAEKLWPETSPVGESLLLRDDAEDPVEATVVGVVADVLHMGYTEDYGTQVYRPLLQEPARRRFLVLSVRGEPDALTGPVRGTLAGIDPNLPATIRPMSELVRENTLQWSLSSLLLGVFGVTALLLASLGIYGVIAYSVVQRRREIGIRMALGATDRRIRSEVLGEGLGLTVTGLVVGVALAAIAGRLMTSLLYGVSPFDPLTYVSVVVLFLVVAIGATLWPALRAARTEPVVVLRYE